MIALLLIAATSTSTGAYAPPPGYVLMSERKVERIKRVTVDAIAKAVDLRIDLDVCEEELGDMMAERDRMRGERDKLRLSLVATPPPAIAEEEPDEWWLMPAIVSVGIAGAAIGALGCAALHCNL